MAERKITDGGRELLAFIRRKGTSIPNWCTEHGLNRFQVQKIVNGSLYKRVSVDLAFAIERATAGKVKAARFVSTTASTTKSVAA